MWKESAKIIEISNVDMSSAANALEKIKDNHGIADNDSRLISTDNGEQILIGKCCKCRSKKNNQSAAFISD